VPDVEAQRSLADAVLDASKAAALRLSAAGQLARSVQRFGPLLTSDQEAALVSTLDQERDPALRTAVAAVVGTLRPGPARTGQRLQQFDALPVPVAPAQAAPEPAPSPPAPPEPAAPAPAPAEGVPPPAEAKP
jgi:hypothetical protein